MIIFDSIIFDSFTLIILPLIIFLISKNYLLTFIVLLFGLHFLYTPNKQNNKTYQKNIFYSPAAGFIKKIQQNGDTLHISYFLNIFDNHTQYLPINSQIIKREHFNGLFEPAYEDHSINNERIVNTLHASDFNFNYTITQVTGLLTRRIYSLGVLNTNYNVGERFGFILLGSRVDIYIPIKYVKNILIEQYSKVDVMTPILELI
jgi:phosphatidylserine decarboxylase